MILTEKLRKYQPHHQAHLIGKKKVQALKHLKAKEQTKTN